MGFKDALGSFSKEKPFFPMWKNGFSSFNIDCGNVMLCIHSIKCRVILKGSVQCGTIAKVKSCVIIWKLNSLIQLSYFLKMPYIVDTLVIVLEFIL